MKEEAGDPTVCRLGNGNVSAPKRKMCLVRGAQVLTRFHLAYLQNIPLAVSLRRKGRDWVCLCLSAGAHLRSLRRQACWMAGVSRPPCTIV